MRILLVGALAWNPERIRSLHERGHEVWGLWSRSMAWDQGPYPSLDGCVTRVGPNDVARVLRREGIDCVCGLFQVYHPRLFAPPTSDVECDVWSLLRGLLVERERGAFDAPIVFHWGFDVQRMDAAVARALDGNVFCNAQKLAYWTEPRRRGGCALDVFRDSPVVAFLDSDRPKQEFMNDDFARRLSDEDGEIHTVCVGRPVGIDFLAAARSGIHVHVYGNRFDETYETIARSLPALLTQETGTVLRRYIHVHASLQAMGGGWDEVRRVKSRWVHEFSRYDAGWSYIGSPVPWEPLEDRAAIPNKISTYLLAGIPIIGDRRPGFYRHEELARLGVGVQLDASDYEGLRSRLEHEVRTRERSTRARVEREGYSFDATIDPLIAAFERAREAYFMRPYAERTRFVGGDRPRMVEFGSSPAARALLGGIVRRVVGAPVDAADGPGPLRRALGAARAWARRPIVTAKAKALAPRLRELLDGDLAHPPSAEQP